MGKISRLISVEATAELNRIYPVFLNQIKIGEAIFLKKNHKEEFEFDVNIDDVNKYDYMFTLDTVSNELVEIRVRFILINNNKIK